LEPSNPDRLAVVLIRPSRYDDEGYVVRHWRGTLPSNTLSCLNGLTEDAVAAGALHPLDVTIHAFDEAVDRIDPRRLVRRLRRPGTRVVVALAGVQTNQFARAQDLARQFKAEGCAVMIGGFHVSGAMATAPATPPECQAMIDEGVTLVLGEVENAWVDLLRDAAAARLRPVYNFLPNLPELETQPLPRFSPRLQRKFAVRGYGTIDAGRGCPFDCSFCTIISVQGRTMRGRGAAHILEHIRREYRVGRRSGIRHYFFTDDNFARNPSWEAILDGLIALRAEGVAVDFMMQVDIAAARIPRFVDKAAAAGCVQVFIGMESLREDNLQAAGKRQNRVQTYRAAIDRWHTAGIVCHVGFIIGFPHDTPERVAEDVRALGEDLLVDQASFFMLTPLPGSRDHRRAVEAGTPMDPDYNNFDSFRAVAPHPLMTAEAWTSAYRDAWTAFYSTDHMRAALLRQNPHTYWGLFKCFLWYRAAMIEGTHPMVTGFVRLKDRRSRRPGWPIEGRVAFFRRRVRELGRLSLAYARLFVEMQELWLATRIRREDYAGAWLPRTLRARGPLDLKTGWSRAHAALAARLSGEGGRIAAAARPVSRIMAARLDALWRAMGSRAGDSAEGAPAITSDPMVVPAPPRSALVRVLARLNVVRPPSVEARRALTAYWTDAAARLRRRQIWRLNPVTLAWNAARDARNTLVFLSAMGSERF
jgi:radical SAM superfamily enzyme YgiQ (UPF0313 family)